MAATYKRTIRGLAGEECEIDVYSVLIAFEVSCPARSHAVKKLLCAGMRGCKPARQDLEEARIAVERAIEIERGRES